jgi:hypothetical protein
MVRLPALVFAIPAGPRLPRSIKVVSKLRQSSTKVSSFAKGKPMDEQARICAGAMSAPERSTSRIGDRGRRIAIAEEEGRFQADRSAARRQHPLVKSIEAKRGKASQMWVAEHD